MKIFVIFLAALALLGSLFGSRHLTRSDVEHALLNQMNGSPAGTITKNVRCVAVKASTTTYRCLLTGTSGSHLKATIEVNGGEWRAEWAPLAG